MRAIDGVRRPGVGVRPQRPIRDAAVIMDQAGVGLLAVIDDDRLVGIVTDLRPAASRVGPGSRSNRSGGEGDE
jgi:CBS domain-containing protein